MHHGTPSASVVRAVMPKDLQEAGIRRITELELADVHDIAVLPGAREALASLVGAKNAIATSCTVPLAAARIAAAHLQPPSVLVTADDVVHGKPHPEPFLEAARRLGVDPRRCLVIEDAPKGLEAAKAAGCFTLAVVTTTPREELSADGIVNDLSEVEFEANGNGIRLKLVNQPTRCRSTSSAHQLLAGLAAKVALRFNRTVPMHLLWTVVEVVLTFTTLLGGKGLAELALGLVLGWLFGARFITSAHGVILTARCLRA